MGKTKQINEIIAKMTVEEKIGQMFMVGIGTCEQLDQRTTEIIQKYHLGGVILFRDNIRDIEQTIRLTSEMQAVSQRFPLLIAVDQEGGLVVRAQFATRMPGNMALGAVNSIEITQKVSEATAAEMKSLGINTNLAPSLDININPLNPVIGIRSFGSSPELVSQHGEAFVRGHNVSGVICCPKHAPGHGDTGIDSHLALPELNYPLDRLNSVELVPFKNAIQNGVNMMMTAHIALPQIDGTTVESECSGIQVHLPATLSYKIVTGVLRNQLGYNNVLISDALMMKAITDHFGIAKAAIMAIEAGLDILLMPQNLDTAYNTVLEAVKIGQLSLERIDQSVRRILKLKAKYRLLDFDTVNRALSEIDVSRARTIIGCAEHKQLERVACDSAVTIIKNNNETIPATLFSNQNIVIFSPRADMNMCIISEINNIAKTRNVTGLQLIPVSYENMWDITPGQINLIKSADMVLMTTACANSSHMIIGESFMPTFISKCTDFAKSISKRCVVIAARNPFDTYYTSAMDAYVAVYGSDENIKSGIRAIFGDFVPTGKLPLRLPSVTEMNMPL